MLAGSGFKGRGDNQMTYQLVKKLSNFLAVFSVLLALGLYVFEETSLFFSFMSILAFTLLIAALILLLIYYRCPACEHLLPFRSYTPPKYCPHCGKKLD